MKPSTILFLVFSAIILLSAGASYLGAKYIVDRHPELRSPIHFKLHIEIGAPKDDKAVGK